MKKRYWLIGALLLYAFFRQTEDGSTVSSSQDAVSSRVERAADIEPVEVSTKPTHELSSAEVETPSSDSLELQPADAPIRYVSGKRVGFRSGPSTTDPIIDRFDTGRKVFLMGKREIGPEFEMISPSTRDGSPPASFPKPRPGRRPHRQGRRKSRRRSRLPFPSFRTQS